MTWLKRLRRELARWLGRGEPARPPLPALATVSAPALPVYRLGQPLNWLQTQLGFEQTTNPAKALIQASIETRFWQRRAHLNMAATTYLRWCNSIGPARAAIEQDIWIGRLPVETRNPDTRLRIVHPVVDVNKLWKTG